MNDNQIAALEKLLSTVARIVEPYNPELSKELKAFDVANTTTASTSTASTSTSTAAANATAEAK